MIITTKNANCASAAVIAQKNTRMPPMSGMQAMAAATFEGKPVEVDFVFASGCGLGGGGGWLGSIGSGMP